MGRNIEIKPSITISREKATWGMYVLFRPKTRSHETWRFGHKDMHFDIDVDSRNLPIGVYAMGLGSGPSGFPREAKLPSIEELIKVLFAASAQLAVFQRFIQDERLKREGDELLREMLSSIPFIFSSEDDGAGELDATGCH